MRPARLEPLLFGRSSESDDLDYCEGCVHLSILRQQALLDLLNLRFMLFESVGHARALFSPEQWNRSMFVWSEEPGAVVIHVPLSCIPPTITLSPSKVWSIASVKYCVVVYPLLSDCQTTGSAVALAVTLTPPS